MNDSYDSYLREQDEQNRIMDRMQDKPMPGNEEAFRAEQFAKRMQLKMDEIDSMNESLNYKQNGKDTLEKSI